MKGTPDLGLLNSSKPSLIYEERKRNKYEFERKGGEGGVMHGNYKVFG